MRTLAVLNLVVVLALVAAPSRVPAQLSTDSPLPPPAFISAEVVGVECPVPGLVNEEWGYPEEVHPPFNALYTLEVLQWHVGSGPDEIEVLYRQGLVVDRGSVAAIKSSATEGPGLLPRGTQLVGSLRYVRPIRHNDGLPQRMLSWAELNDVQLLVEGTDGQHFIAQRSHVRWKAPPDSIPAAEVDLAQITNEAQLGALIPTDRTPESAAADWEERLGRERAWRSKHRP